MVKTKRLLGTLYVQVLIAIFAGILLGVLYPKLGADLAFNAIWPLVSIPDHLRYVFGSLLIFGSLPAARKFGGVDLTSDLE